MIRATDFYDEADYYAALEERVATDREAMIEHAWAVGVEHRDRAWLLDDRDVWVRNPHYHGPAVRHPEDDRDDDEVECPLAADAADFIPF